MDTLEGGNSIDDGSNIGKETKQALIALKSSVNEWSKEKNKPIVEEILFKKTFIQIQYFESIEFMKSPNSVKNKVILDEFYEQFAQEMATGIPQNVNNFLDIKIGEYALTGALEQELKENNDKDDKPQPKKEKVNPAKIKQDLRKNNKKGSPKKREIYRTV